MVGSDAVEPLGETAFLSERRRLRRNLAIQERTRHPQRRIGGQFRIGGFVSLRSIRSTAPSKPQPLGARICNPPRCPRLGQAPEAVGDLEG